MDRLELERFLRDKMPLAKAMDVRVLRVDESVVELMCPLAPNHNHLGSAFGGSLGAIMILAAYCRLFHLLNGTGHVLLKSSSMEFLQPVNEELRAICHLPPTEASQKFLKAYQLKGRARLSLMSETLLKDGTVAARMTGEFMGRVQ